MGAVREGFQAVSGSLYLLTISAVGVRLLVLAGRNRALPELLLGLAFLLGGTLGATAEVVAQTRADALGPLLAGRVLLVGKLASCAGLACYGVFVWRVFRPDALWAPALAAALLAVTLLAIAGFAAAGAFSRGALPDGWFWVEFAARMASPVWLAVEAFLYHARMQRRVRLGLADPLVANRFLLWGLGAGFGLLMLLTSVPPRFVPRDHPWMPLDVALLGLAGIASAAAYWLAFFRPEAYRRRFRRPAAAA
jgi:hypothetical protein